MRNVTLLDRPIRVTAVISTVRARCADAAGNVPAARRARRAQSSRQDAERARDDADAPTG
jgi:hypothetical protein